jgi:hypothetical protein
MPLSNFEQKFNFQNRKKKFKYFWKISKLHIAEYAFILQLQKGYALKN